MIPGFVDVGQPDLLLPHGVHEATPEEVYDALVTPFTGSSSREEIFAGWSAFRVSIRALVDVQLEFMDGSFVTNREDPDDVDLSLWVEATDLDALTPLQKLSLRKLMKTAKPSFRCDAYIVPRCGQNHPAWPEFEHLRGWTRRYWRAYKDPDDNVIPGVAKGYVSVTP